MNEKSVNSVTPEREVSEMELKTTQELILKLKSVKDDRRLSIYDIMDLLSDIHEPLSESTVRRVFSENSEMIGNFSYETTLRPLATVLFAQGELGDDVQGTIAKERINGLLDVIGIKNQTIDQLTAQIESLKEDHEKRCKEYEQRMDFLRDQIEKKDRRMDQKDEIITRLMEKCL